MKLELRGAGSNTITASYALLDAIWRALAREPRLRDFEHRDVTVALDGSELVLDGELPDLGSKVRALHVARGFPQLDRVIDRLVVTPSVQGDDRVMRSMLVGALAAHPAYSDCRLVSRGAATPAIVRAPERPHGTVEADVSEGIIVLEGRVPSLVHRTIAARLAWHVPGARAVRDELEAPRDDASDEELNDAVLAALDDEPSLQDARVAAATHRQCVTLGGSVRGEEQRRAAERGAWCIEGVLDVFNRIAVSPR